MEAFPAPDQLKNASPKTEELKTEELAELEAVDPGLVKQARQKQTVLVTGHAGFIGFHLLENLLFALFTMLAKLTRDRAWTTRAEVAALSVEKRAQISAAQKLGTSTEDLTAHFGVSDGALRLLNETTKTSAKMSRAMFW